MKFSTTNKIYGKLKVKYFEMPNASYTNRYELKMMKYLNLLSLLFLFISCNTENSINLSSNHNIKKIFTAEEIEGLETLNQFFNSQICDETEKNEKQCYISFFRSMNANNKLGYVELNLDYKTQKAIYSQINQTTFDEIWSFSTNMYTDSIGEIIYNRDGKFMAFIKEVAKEDMLIEEYLILYEEAGDIYPGMIEKYHFKGNESQNFKLIIAIHYLTLNDRFERKK